MGETRGLPTSARQQGKTFSLSSAVPNCHLHEPRVIVLIEQQNENSRGCQQNNNIRLTCSFAFSFVAYFCLFLNKLLLFRFTPFRGLCLFCLAPLFRFGDRHIKRDSAKAVPGVERRCNTLVRAFEKPSAPNGCPLESL
jgi:hypothetical protein